MNRLQKSIPLVLAVIALLITIGCGGNSGTKTASTGPTPSPTPVASPTPSPSPTPIDPSGNWKMTFTDSNNQFFILSALFSQTGDVVTGVNFSEVGNVQPGFTCTAQRDITITGGLVQNVSNFVGNINGNFGTIAINTTLNNAGTEAVGTYTLTGSNAGCLGVALTGTLLADEVPSMTGTWTGTISCLRNCPIETPPGTSGTITMALAEDDTTGAITGTYTIAGMLPVLSAGMIVPDTNDFLSGSSIQQRLLDSTGNITVIVGGPLNSFGTPGVALDRTFGGNIIALTGPNVSQNTVYAVTMSH
jgi:hypothetical protein